MKRVLLGVALALWAQHAAALFGFGGSRCDPTDNDAAEATRVIGEMTEQLTALEHAILNALKLHAAQVSGVITQNANAFGSAIDGANAVRAEMLRDVEESRAMRDHAPSETVCEGITGMSGLGPGREQQASVSRERSASMLGRLTQDPTVVAVSGEAGDTRARYERLAQIYCNPARTASGSEACSGPGELHGADLHPGALLGKATLSDAVERETATDWARNIAVPVAWDRMPLRDPGTTVGRRRMLRERAFDARAALAGGLLNHLYGMRVPAVKLGGWARAVLPDGMGPQAEAVSHYELLETLTHRFESPDYFLRLQAQGDTNLLRELVQLRAIDLMLDWERYRLAEYQGAMTAALLALETERDRARARTSAR